MNWAKGRATRGRGTSFKGALQYALHDKGAKTADRVGRVALRNLAAANGNDAWREMMTLCEAADELKRRAGGRLTGRKLTLPVYAFTLNWHEDDEPDVDHMLETAEAALKVLGMEGLQAVVVEHTDTDHRHVHIIVNLVDPVTGKAASLSNDDHKLDRWADSYEVTRGTIRSPDRRAKFDALDRGEKPARRPKQAACRSEWETRKARGEAIKTEAAAIRAGHAACVAQLKAAQATCEQQRGAERERLWNAYQAARKAIQGRYKPFLEAVYARRSSPLPSPAVMAGLRALDDYGEWHALGHDHAYRRRTFHRRERSSLGIIINIIGLYARLNRGGLAALFFLSVSPKYRARLLGQALEQDKLALSAAQGQRRKAHADALRAACRSELGVAAATFRDGQTTLRKAHGSAFAAQFTPTCHKNHLPSFLAHLDAIKAKGVDAVICTSTNDAFVMDAWAEHTGGKGKIDFLSDGNGDFAKATGLSMDGSGFGLGLRSKRYAMIVNDGKVTWMAVEDVPSKAEASGAEAVLGQL